MARQITTFLVSLSTPGLGYLHIGDKKNFYRTISVFFMIIISGIIFRSFTNFAGLSFVSISLFIIYLSAALHSAIKAKSTNREIHSTGPLKLVFTISFILLTGFSFANRRVVMGFDIMSMAVPVMQPAVLQGDKFLVDTWAYNNNKPGRGDIIAHSFSSQNGLYLNRIIAIENDKIEIRNGVVIINGQKLDEPYVLSLHVTKPESKNMKEIIIPKGHYFVMGDNRDESFGDSRFSGTITIESIEGRITDIISSRDKSRIGTAVK